jgi:PAT family beta-lactamase induction signal transducer AmpG
MSSWRDSLAIHLRPRLLAVLFMGFGSGLPLPLTFGTLSFWLAESGVSREAIGAFSLVGTAYSIKFLWAPAIDRLGLGPWTRLFGRRRGWALAIQMALAGAILFLGSTDPRIDPAMTALAAVIVAVLSASQDIVIDAYRIELLKPEEQGAGAAATQFGYRFGMMASSAGALYAAEFGGWSTSFAIMAALMGIGALTVLFTREPAQSAKTDAEAAPKSMAAWFQSAVVGPFADFATRPSWVLILVFVVAYKFGDALAGVMANAFYVSTGFTRLEVANISKIFGVAATLAGLAAGGVIVHRRGVYPALLVCGLLQALSNLIYCLQAIVGHDVTLLVVTIGVENFTGGMGSAAFVAYLSGLCNVAYTATQYALLSALASVGRTTLSAWGGWLAAQLDWVWFFAATTLAALPGIVLVLVLMKRFPEAGKRSPISG